MNTGHSSGFAKNAKDNPNAARISAKNAGFLLGFDEDEISILSSQRILKSLGKPTPNATKYFARFYIESLMGDEGFLNKATQAIYDYHREKNGRKKNPAQGGVSLEIAA